MGKVVDHATSLRFLVPPKYMASVSIKDAGGGTLERDTTDDDEDLETYANRFPPNRLGMSYAFRVRRYKLVWDSHEDDPMKELSLEDIRTQSQKIGKFLGFDKKMLHIKNQSGGRLSVDVHTSLDPLMNQMDDDGMLDGAASPFDWPILHKNDPMDGWSEIELLAKDDAAYYAIYLSFHPRCLLGPVIPLGSDGVPKLRKDKSGPVQIVIDVYDDDTRKLERHLIRCVGAA